MDVSSSGLRLRTRAKLRVGQAITCRVAFSDHAELLRMRVLWCASSAPGEEADFGVRYEPVLPGTQHLLGNYLLRVLNRAV